MAVLDAPMNPPAPPAPSDAPEPPAGPRDAPGAGRRWIPGRAFSWLTWRSREGDPRWYRPALLALLAATAVAYLWGLGANGWANSYYAAAVQAGASSWKALFFGSFDSANAITVDKAPAALWVMGISARIFGVNSWSILVPQALMGVGSVALVTATVKRWFRPGAALLAGAVLATTPVAALMFRFNNPDALLVLLLCAAAYAVTRALEHASWRWITLAGSLVGVAFLAKMLQSFLVLPAFGLVYLLAAPTSFWRRIGHLAAMAVAMVVSAGWWVAVVELWPASSRPYIGGSQHNSVLELVLGYNGLGRLTGNETGSVGGTGQAGSQWGPTGWLRMFNAPFGGQISWLLPAALVLLVGGLVWTSRRPRTDRTRAALLLWGGWLLVTGLTFSLSQGIIHEYYSVALAPAIGALVGIGGSLLWEHRDRLSARLLLAAAVAVTAAWTWVLLGRSPDWQPWLRPTVIAVSVAAVVLLALGDRVRRGAVTAVGLGVVLAVAAGLAAPVASTVTTVRSPQTGSIVTAGPATTGAAGNLPAPPAGLNFPGAGVPTGPPNGATGAPTGATAGARAGGGGGLLQASEPSQELVTVLSEDAGHFTWVAATVGAMQGAGYQLATDHPVLAIGGFNGSDPSPTLAEFQAKVSAGQVHWFIAGGMGGGPGGGVPSGGSGASSEITTWVTANFAATTVGGVTLYDLTAPVGG